MPRDASRTRQNKFLKAFVELKIIQRACDAIGLKRGTFQSWMDTDPEFQRKMECLESAIDDEALELLYKKVGLLKMNEEEKSRGLHKWADNNLLIRLVKRMPRFKESVVVNQTIMQLPIVGLSGPDLAGLIAPDKAGIEETRGEINVTPRGPEFPGVDEEVKKLLARDDAEGAPPADSAG